MISTIVLLLTCPRAARSTVPPGVVHHPALGVHLGGAPGLARVAVPGGALGVLLARVGEGEDAGLGAGAHCPTGL